VINATLRPLYFRVLLVQEARREPALVWTGADILAPTGIRSPDHPARTEWLHRPSYPSPFSSHKKVKNINFNQEQTFQSPYQPGTQVGEHHVIILATNTLTEVIHDEYAAGFFKIYDLLASIIVSKCILRVKCDECLSQYAHIVPKHAPSAIAYWE
jgi:hypothetical protein